MRHGSKQWLSDNECLLSWTPCPVGSRGQNEGHVRGVVVTARVFDSGLLFLWDCDNSVPTQAGLLASLRLQSVRSDAASQSKSLAKDVGHVKGKAIWKRCSH